MAGEELIRETALWLRQEAVRTFQRRMLVLSGDARWCRRQARALLDALSLSPLLWLGEQAPDNVWQLEAARAHKVLGRELALAVFDAHDGFDADAFGAIGGSVQGGGLLVLLIPPLAQWTQASEPLQQQRASREGTARFLQRLVVALLAAEGIAVIGQDESGGARMVVQREPRQALAAQRPVNAGLHIEACLTADQCRAVEALEKVCSGHRHRPLVLVSDRGRGKSSALGIASARLLRQGVQEIVVTAPRLDAVEPLFAHAARLLPGAETARGRVRYGTAVVRFLPPDELVHYTGRPGLVLVDEAAAIPAPLLERLLARFARIAFASTIHGYEGTGRGFAVRFQRVLDASTPGWSECRLETPIRWAMGDPLERLLFHALLLDAAPVAEAQLSELSTRQCVIERLDRDVLVNDEVTLGELFGLLVLAHYRTSPADLQQLLDGTELEVWTARQEGHVVATALVSLEGGFDEALAREIWLGRRRPRGHLLAQSLLAHAGFIEAAPLRYARIMRIAVHPQLQRQGLGSRLVSAIGTHYEQAGLDALGASFGATADLLDFWAGCGLLPVHLGIGRGKSSGTHAAVVLKALSDAAGGLFQRTRERWNRQLPELLESVYQDLEPPLADALLQHCDGGGVSGGELEPQDWQELLAFAFGLRGYELTLVALRRLVATALEDEAVAGLLSSVQRSLLLGRVMQGRGWSEVAAAHGLSGRAQVLEALREAARALVLHYGSEAVREQVKEIK